MSFYPQPDKYRCGPFALKHALVMLGVFRHENEIAVESGSTWWAGTDEIGLAKAAKKYNCKMKHFQSSNPNDARRMLNEKLKKGIPCIAAVSNWEHWIAIVNYSKGRYVVIDSEFDKVISVKTAGQLMRYWRYRDYEDNIISYDGYAIHPEFKVHTKAKITPERAAYIMYKKNDELAKKWDKYFNDLMDICKPRTKLTINYITFSEFLRRNQKALIKKVANWHGIPTYSELNKILNHMEIIADTYDLIIHLNDEKNALIDLTSILMMYACGKYGMDPIY